MGPLRDQGAEGIQSPVIKALQGQVTAICVGPITGEVFSRINVPTKQPTQSRLGALVREVVEQLAARRRIVQCADGMIDLRGHAVVVGGKLQPMAPAPMAILRALADDPGYVGSRGALANVLRGGSDNI